MEEMAKEKELLSLIESATAYRAANRDNEYITNRAHYEGLQWNLAENKNDSPFLMRSDINHLKNAVDLRLGSLCSDKYWGELKPLSPDDVQNIEELNVLYKNEWNRLKADDVIEAVVKEGAICDNGYVQINVDANKIIGGTNTRKEGAITLKVLSTSDVYLDPTAASLEEINFYVIKSAQSKTWVKQNKPEWLSKIKKDNLDVGLVNEETEGNIYTGRDYGQSKNNLYDINTLYRKEPEKVSIDVIDDNGKSKKEKITVTRIVEYTFINKHLVEENRNYPFDEFSLIGFQWEPIPQSPYGIPLLRGLTVPQKVANLIESAANNIAMHYTIPSWLVSAESGIDLDEFAKLNSALGMAWKVNGDVSRAIKQMDPPQINKDLIAIKESFVANIKTYAGVSDTYIGNIGTAGSTAEGTMSAINRATIIDNGPTKQIEKFVEKLSRMIVKFMLRYYKGDTLYVRDTQKNSNKYEFKPLTVNENYSNMNYEFFVDLASRSKTDKNRQYNLMKELYTIQNQYKDDKKVINVTDLVKAAQLDNYNEMFKRFSDMSEEAFAEKADLIVQIMSIGQVTTPNGQPLITDEQMQQGIMDVLDDNGSLTSVEEIFKTYEDYQTQVTELKMAYENNQRQQEINNLQSAQTAQGQLMESMLNGRQAMMNNQEG
jgi:hypothetical protein